MDKILLHRLVAALDDEEVKRAKRFLASPFHNTDPLLEQYFALLCKYRPELDSPHLASEAVFKALISRSQPFDDKKVRNLRYKLAQALRSFLAHQSLENDKHTRQQLVVKNLGKRDDYGLFQHEAQAFGEMLEKDDNRGLDYHWHKTRLSHDIYFHPETDRIHEGQALFWGTVEHLEKFFSLLMFFYKIEAETRIRILKEDGNTIFLDGIPERLMQCFGSEEMHASLFFKLAIPDSFFIQELSEKLEDYNHLLGNFEYSMAWKILFSYAVRMSNQTDETVFHQQIYRLYKTGIDKNIITKREIKDPTRFINISFASDLAGAFDWTEHFIEINKKHLNDAVRNNIVNFCLAHMRYHRGWKARDSIDLGHAMRLISQVEHLDEAYEFRLRSLQLRILYDNLSKDPAIKDILLQYTRNFKKYLTRNQRLSKDLIQSLQRFVKYFQELIKFATINPIPLEAIETLRKKLETEKELKFKMWLLERAAELMKNERGG